MKDDPREAASPSTIGLAAIAALVAGRPREAGDLADPRLTGTDEVALWRALQTAMTDEGSPKAAAVLATTAPLLFTYPAELRRRVLPLALETMILGGAADAAEPLLAQREDDPGLAYARALLLQAKGENDAALAGFDAVANSRSTFDHARAAIHAIELRLTMGQLDNKTAPDALLYAWRGDQRDLALRLRIAELRSKTGEWRSVFAQLRGAKADFPGQAMEIDRRLKEAFAAVPRDPGLDKMLPTELIALLDENAELMANGPDGEPMRELLAEKLMALDLPKRADPLLTKLMRAAPYGPARAGFGATLATMRLHEDDGDGALLALSESNSADMPDAVRERRALIAARVEAKRGHISAAVEALAGSHSPEADETRANILEQARDWPAARDALVVLVAHVVPESGVLTDAQLGIMPRLATAATRAGDDATLASLREKLRTRIAMGPRADLFQLLTAEPVRGTADLGRARAEMGLARAVTADMGPKKPAGKPP
jgi:tetratricopeptide (TPR) repeat protein